MKARIAQIEVHMMQNTALDNQITDILSKHIGNIMIDIKELDPHLCPLVLATLNKVEIWEE